MTKDAVTNKWTGKEGGLNVYCLYDRSGSMANKQDEAVPALNAYIQALDSDTVVTIVAFDSTEPHKVIRDHVRVRDYDAITIAEVNCRGMTPLYDATGWIIDQIIRDNPHKAVLVVQTDGQENQSREYNYENITKRIKEMKAKDFPVVFLGSEFKEVGSVSGGLGVSLGNTVNMTRGNYNSVAAAMACSTQLYSSGRATQDWFSAEDKTKLGDTDTIDPKDKKNKKA